MRKPMIIGAMLIFGVAFALTTGAERPAAQGPAGAGAAEAVQENTRSLNPANWIKKQPQDSVDEPEHRSELEKKLTPSLQARGLLGANTTATDTCATFTMLEGCLAALHASHSLGLEFNCLRSSLTGVHTSEDVSACKVDDEGQAHSLAAAIHLLKADANAKQAAKDAEQQAKDDLKAAGE